MVSGGFAKAACEFEVIGRCIYFKLQLLRQSAVHKAARQVVGEDIIRKPEVKPAGLIQRFELAGRKREIQAREAAPLKWRFASPPPAEAGC